MGLEGNIMCILFWDLEVNIPEPVSYGLEVNIG